MRDGYVRYVVNILSEISLNLLKFTQVLLIQFSLELFDRSEITIRLHFF